MNFLTWCPSSYAGNQIFNVVIVMVFILYYVFVFSFYNKFINLIRKAGCPSSWESVFPLLYILATGFIFVMMMSKSFSFATPLNDSMNWGESNIHSYSTIRLVYRFDYVLMCIFLAMNLINFIIRVISKKLSKVKIKKYIPGIVISFIIGIVIYTGISIECYIYLDKIADDYDIVEYGCD